MKVRLTDKKRSMEFSSVKAIAAGKDKATLVTDDYSHPDSIVYPEPLVWSPYNERGGDDPHLWEEIEIVNHGEGDCCAITNSLVAYFTKDALLFVEGFSCKPGCHYTDWEDAIVVEVDYRELNRIAVAVSGVVRCLEEPQGTTTVKLQDEVRRHKTVRLHDSFVGGEGVV